MTTNNWHVGRSFTGHHLEDQCECEQFPCGLVLMNGNPECPQHGIKFAKAIRQGHAAKDCLMSNGH